ncbi:MAG: glycerol-3-phosphate 1-O-acyltransferase PlsY [Acidobacteria bacterium]|nr:glycerol-3-phosphate 1-O-acyltransferase PlsY [Acidobacteriota bacterium]
MSNALGVLIVCYLIGGIPFGYLLVRWRTGADVRAAGSGNIGATNVLRTTGRALGIGTLLLDIAKGALAVWLMDLTVAGLSPEMQALWTSLAAVVVMLGHGFPIFLKFQGGKAVASFIGAFLYLTPLPLFAVLLLFVAVVWVTRYISLGSILAAALFPLAVYLILHPDGSILAAAAFSGAFIVWRHKSNIHRLRAGSENRFTFSKKKA